MNRKEKAEDTVRMINDITLQAEEINKTPAWKKKPEELYL